MELSQDSPFFLCSFPLSETRSPLILASRANELQFKERSTANIQYGKCGGRNSLINCVCKTASTGYIVGLITSSYSRSAFQNNPEHMLWGLDMRRQLNGNLYVILDKGACKPQHGSDWLECRGGFLRS